MASPILGIIIDKQGKRALFIMASSVLILAACIWTIFIPTVTSAQSGDPVNHAMCLGPLCLLGIGYSVYAAALWGCIPYTVPARLVGTAYGLCTAIQNIGLTISPMVSSFLLGGSMNQKEGVAEEVQREQGYFNLMVYFSMLSFCGIIFNLCLYLDDINNRNGTLNAIDSKAVLEQNQKEAENE